jgi:DNA-directed RNA polymerase specialized sigma24 family protein
MSTEDFTPNGSEEHTSHPESCQLDPTGQANPKEARRKFEDDFLELQRASSSSGRLMYVFVRRSLWQFHLAGTYTEACILNEAYIRGCETLGKGETIRNTGAWLRATVYNIIREYSRYHQKLETLEESILQDIESPMFSETVEDDLAILRLALQMLSTKDQLLLNLKIAERLSWKEVQDALKLQGMGTYSEVSLRKRKERALIKLRKKFHSLKPAL